MTQAVDFKYQLPKLKRFQEFVFIGDSALKLTPKLLNLQFTPESNFLDRAKIGDRLTIQQICAPQNIICQLQNLQFQPEQKVQLVSRTNNGSVVVKLNNTLVGMGKEIAQRVVVTLVGEGQ